MKAYSGKIAVVTGASAGMGRGLAVQLAESGAQLALCDVNLEGLEETAQLCRAHGIEPLVSYVNVAEEAAVAAFADAVEERFGHVDYLFNNAGIAFGGTFAKSSIKDLERVMDVDFWGVVYGSKSFLPLLERSEEGHIVNTSSIFGLFGVPSQGAYNAAKFAVRGFSESLRQEMLIAGNKIKVSCVHPGGIKTDIARNATSADGELEDRHVQAFDKLTITSADRAATIILKGAAKGKPKILVGPDAVVIDLLIRGLGSAYQRPLSALTKRLAPEFF